MNNGISRREIVGIAGLAQLIFTFLGFQKQKDRDISLELHTTAAHLSELNNKFLIDYAKKEYEVEGTIGYENGQFIGSNSAPDPFYSKHDWYCFRGEFPGELQVNLTKNQKYTDLILFFEFQKKRVGSIDGITRILKCENIQIEEISSCKGKIKDLDIDHFDCLHYHMPNGVACFYPEYDGRLKATWEATITTEKFDETFVTLLGAYKSFVSGNFT